MSLPAVNWSLQALLEPLVADEVPDVNVTGVCLDSRLIQTGDAYLAVAGGQTHGMRYAAAAVTNGAVAVLVSSHCVKQFDAEISSLNEQGIPVVQVPGLEESCAEIAGRCYDDPDSKMTLVAVTGTDGKTSVCRFIASAFAAMGKKCGYIGTLGWGLADELQATELTTPDVVSLRRMLADLHQRGAEFIAMEASSHGIAEGRLDGLRLDIAVLTNLGRDHLDYHKSIEAYRAVKASLFRWSDLSAVVLNGCDSLGRDLAQELTEVSQQIYCSDQSCIDRLAANRTPVVAVDILPHDSGLQFTLIESDVRHVVSTGLLGQFNVDNLLACYATLRASGVAANDAVFALQKIHAVPGRMERMGGGVKPAVVIDYCHTPQALQVALEAVRVHCDKCLWVVFGCGGDRDAGKRVPMAQAAEMADRIVVTNDNPRTEDSTDILRQIVAGFTDSSSVSVIADRASAIRHAISSASAGDLVLIAGKGHEDYQIVGTKRYPFSDREQALSALELVS
ncbi:MAG: UDP-N-acetylmuramoyl-L-alanyl-D-glutamate--2,6-diaminopimelate ligase [Granulosicoccus sp.]